MIAVCKFVCERERSVKLLFTDTKRYSKLFFCFQVGTKIPMVIMEMMGTHFVHLELVCHMVLHSLLEMLQVAVSTLLTTHVFTLRMVLIQVSIYNITQWVFSHCIVLVKQFFKTDLESTHSRVFFLSFFFNHWKHESVNLNEVYFQARFHFSLFFNFTSLET